MSLCDGLAETVRERVQHAVMGMNGRQAVLLQLIGHNAHQLLHTLIIVGPVAYNLKYNTASIKNSHLSANVHINVAYTPVDSEPGYNKHQGSQA